MTESQHRRLTVAAMYLGLALTVAATIVPYIDHATANVLADHIQDGYPAYSQSRVDSAVTTYLVLLTIVGTMGAIGWVWAIRTVRAGHRWARATATGMCALGTAVALTGLFIRDTSGATGLPPLLGWIGMLPCLAGLLAVTLLWKQS